MSSGSRPRSARDRSDQDADEHDRLLALTSHLPHALANLLIGRVAAAAAGNEAPLEHAGASLRDMTRIAGANPAVWIDIFVENGDLIADALEAYGADLEDVERALRAGDRSYFERTIAGAADTRSRMLAHAYRTEATQINRIRIRVPDRPGVLAQITQILGAAGINIEDFELRHVSPEYGGVLVILVNGADPANRARALLRREGLRRRLRKTAPRRCPVVPSETSARKERTDARSENSTGSRGDRGRDGGRRRGDGGNRVDVREERNREGGEGREVRHRPRRRERDDAVPLHARQEERQRVQRRMREPTGRRCSSRERPSRPSAPARPRACSGRRCARTARSR